MIVFISGNVFLLQANFDRPAALRGQGGLFEVFRALLDQDGLRDGLFTEIGVLFLLCGGHDLNNFCDGEEPISAVGQ